MHSPAELSSAKHSFKHSLYSSAPCWLYQEKYILLTKIKKQDEDCGAEFQHLRKRPTNIQSRGTMYIQVRQQSEMPLYFSLLGDKGLKRFAGNLAGLPGYTIVHSNNVLLEATKPEQTNQSRGGGVHKSKTPSKAPYFCASFPIHVLILTVWQKACWRGGAVKHPGPTLCPASRANWLCCPEEQRSSEAGMLAGMSNALTAHSSWLLCWTDHVSLCTLHAGMYSLSTLTPPEDSCLSQSI